MKKINTYIRKQLDRLTDSELYSKSIKIFDGEGNSTNYFNIDEKTFKKIKKLLLEIPED